MNTVILAQCAGMNADLLFTNGFLLSYFAILAVPSGYILILLAMPSLLRFLLMLPFAYLSDIYGKKRLGTIGLAGTVLGFFILLLSSLFHSSLTFGVLGLGIAVYGIGHTLFISS